jgi:hypothetical protein
VGLRVVRGLSRYSGTDAKSGGCFRVEPTLKAKVDLRLTL